ncbi:MAG: glycosyltransferase, partial [Longimicrobiales bacterium]
MRILLVNDYGTATGGAEVLFLLLRRLLRERGHAVRLFSSSARPLGAPCEADDTCFGTTTTARTTLQAANPWAAARIGDVLRDFRPDVVHVGVFLTQLSPSILPRLRDIPALFHVHWYRAVCPLGTKRLPNARDCNEPWGTACLRNGCLTLRAWLPMMAQRQLWHRYRDVFDRTIACGDAVRRRLEEAGFPNIEVVPNCVAPRQQRPALQDPPTAAFSGRLVAEKGVDVLVDAFSQVVRELPGARL